MIYLFCSKMIMIEWKLTTICHQEPWLSTSARWRGQPLQWRHNGTIASQITSLVIVYSAVYSDADQRKHQSSASLAFVWGIHRRPVNSPHKWPVTRKMFPLDDVIVTTAPGTKPWPIPTTSTQAFGQVTGIYIRIRYLQIIPDLQMRCSELRWMVRVCNPSNGFYGNTSHNCNRSKDYPL